MSTINDNVSYAVEIVKEGLHAVRIDLQDGSVIGVTQKQVPPKEWKQLDAFDEARVTLVEAISIAQKELPGGRLASAEVKDQKKSGRVLKVAPKLDN